MPGGDGTGPLGLGPMTGRSAGFCAEYSLPGYANPVIGRGCFFKGFLGRGFGRDRGRGYRNWYYASGLPGWTKFNQGFYPWDSNIPYTYTRPDITPEQEIEVLKNQSKYMEESMDAINERIRELEKISIKKKD